MVLHINLHCDNRAGVITRTLPCQACTFQVHIATKLNLPQGQTQVTNLYITENFLTLSEMVLANQHKIKNHISILFHIW